MKIREEWDWHTRKFTIENFQRWIAYKIPRKIALFTFIRVYAAESSAPDPSYERVYRAWEAGAGR